jgi:2-aminoadipate transaminase
MVAKNTYFKIKEVKMKTPWEYRYAQRTQLMASSAVRELLKLTEEPDIISFAGGMPAPEVFPIEEFRQACDKVLRNHGAQALQYGTTEGFLPLREMIARHTSKYGIEINVDNILITTGSQQALDLIGKIFINPGDRVLVESPTYLGALQAWNAYGVEYITVPVDQQGLITDALEEALRTGPKFIYVLPNFQNPTGTTLSLERRLKLVELADRYGVPLIEDDPYGQLRYEGEHIPSIIVLDGQMRENRASYNHGNVIYISTFSKILAPGLRLAWMIAPPEVIHKLVQAKQGADLHTATFSQMTAYEVSRGGFLDRHIKLLRQVYRERRDTMLSSLEHYLPPNIQWTHPNGGLFLWTTLPPNLDADDLLRAAMESRVAFVPGQPFHPRGGGYNTMRLNFSNAKPEDIEEGIQKLGEAIRELIYLTALA